MSLGGSTQKVNVRFRIKCPAPESDTQVVNRFSYGEHRCRMVDDAQSPASNSGRMSEVKVVAHMGITVRDLDASIRFWCNALGFEVQHRLELSGEFAEQITG